MIRSYIFHEDKNNWLEEEYLLYHDLCALLDEEDHIIYLWNGPESSRDRLEKGYGSVVDLIANMPVENPLQLTILTEDVPPNVQKKLDAMLERVREEEMRETLKFSNLKSIRAYFICLLLGIVFPILTFFVALSSLGWPSASGIAEVGAGVYATWIIAAIVLMAIGLTAYIGCAIIGILERDLQAAVFASIAILISIGFLIYYSQGVFLFLFENNSTSSTYYISQLQLGLFVFINLVGIIVLEAPNVYKFITFFKDYNYYIY